VIFPSPICRNCCSRSCFAKVCSHTFHVHLLASHSILSCYMHACPKSSFKGVSRQKLTARAKSYCAWARGQLGRSAHLFQPFHCSSPTPTYIALRKSQYQLAHVLWTRFPRVDMLSRRLLKMCSTPHTLAGVAFALSRAVYTDLSLLRQLQLKIR
jgi:hypothetical protein